MRDQVVNDVPCGERGVSMVFQNYALFPHMSVKNNIIYGLKAHKMDENEINARLKEVLKMLELEGLEDRKPKELSGGMRQRAALIRTLVLEPDILLLDEPFSALDYQTRLEVSDDIFRIIKEQEKTALLVTHDISEAIAMGEQVIVLSSRPAGIKNVFDIHLSVDKRTPFSSRTAPEFSAYFHQIWKELS